jgi:hypothetical protein
MRKLILGLVLLAAVQTGFCQEEFINKLWKQPTSTASYFRLDYFSNWKTIAGEKKTSLFLSFIPRPGASVFMSYSGWNSIKIRDRATGKEYKITNGNGITLRNDAVFAFHNKTDEIGFYLDFEPMPSTVRNIDVFWADSKWFENVPIDPTKTEDGIFALSYLLRTISMYTTVSKNIYFNFENSSQSDLYINRYYQAPNRPTDGTASGTITLAFPISEQDTPYNIYAYYHEGETENNWKFTATPGIASQLIVLNSGR